MSSKGKPKILLCWGYHRKGWLHALNALSDTFDFHYLFHIDKPKDEVNHAKSSTIHYWSDYNSAQHLLKVIQPEKVVFMSIEAPNTIALNVVAKAKGIETLILQHGMFHQYADYLRLAKEEMQERQKQQKFEKSDVKVDRMFLLKFFLRSVVFTSPDAIFYFAKLRRLKNKMLEIEALKNAQSTYRTPKKYIVYTKYNASIYNERDGVSINKMIEIGNPEMDEYFNYNHPRSVSSPKYYLLIDQPWSEVKAYGSPGFGISKEQTIAFYTKLYEYCKTNDALLKVKLHPYSYGADFLIDHSNIEYIEDANMVSLIMESEGVFGFNSTLTQPAIYFKKCCLFKIWEESSYQNDIHQLGVAQVLKYHEFSPDSIQLENIVQISEARQTFVANYFYRTDGKATERLRENLQP